LVFGDDTEGNIYALHMSSITTTTQQQHRIATGFDYVVPFRSVHPIYSWTLRCSPDVDDDNNDGAYGMNLFCVQSKAVQLLTLVSGMCVGHGSAVGIEEGLSADVTVLEMDSEVDGVGGGGGEEEAGVKDGQEQPSSSSKNVTEGEEEEEEYEVYDEEEEGYECSSSEDDDDDDDEDDDDIDEEDDDDSKNDTTTLIRSPPFSYMPLPTIGGMSNTTTNAQSQTNRQQQQHR